MGVITEMEKKVTMEAKKKLDEAKKKLGEKIMEAKDARNKIIGFLKNDVGAYDEDDENHYAELKKAWLKATGENWNTVNKQKNEEVITEMEKKVTMEAKKKLDEAKKKLGEKIMEAKDARNKI